jgi:hypothetical protein
MDDEKFVRRLAETLEKVFPNYQEPPKFGGSPGKPVAVVDAEDVKTVWQIRREMGPNTAMGVDVMKQVCKPGTDIEGLLSQSYG